MVGSRSPAQLMVGTITGSSLQLNFCRTLSQGPGAQLDSLGLQGVDPHSWHTAATSLTRYGACSCFVCSDVLLNPQQIRMACKQTLVDRGPQHAVNFSCGSLPFFLFQPDQDVSGRSSAASQEVLRCVSCRYSTECVIMGWALAGLWLCSQSLRWA